MSPPPQRRKKSRYALPLVLALAASAILVGMGYRSSRSYERARALFEARQFGRALETLESWPGLRLRSPKIRHEGDLLGFECAMALDSPKRARQWLERAPANSAGAVEAVLRSSMQAMARGRLADAETILRFWLNRSDPPSGRVARQLTEIFWLQCRFEEAESLYPLMFDGSTPPLAVLQNALANDPRALRPERQRASLEKLRALAPDDDRVRLGLARLDILQGDFGSAIERLGPLRPSMDLAYWLARRDLAIATQDYETLALGLNATGIPADDVAWNARLNSLTGVPMGPESIETFTKFAIEQGSAEDLELAARLAMAASEKNEAIRLRRIKQERDEAFESYRRGLQTIVSARDMPGIEALADLARRAGRPLDAEVLRYLLHDPDARAIPSIRSRTPGLRHESGPNVTVTGEVMKNDWLRRIAELRKSSGASLQEHAAGGKTPVDTDASPDPVFEDVTAASGIDFVFDSGKSVIRQLPETMGGGVAILDYDGDGHSDIYAVQGGPFGSGQTADRPGDRLFRNTGDGSFEDVTARAGLPDRSTGYGFGVTTGDFDGDGHCDLFVTRWRKVELWRNRGDGTFEDVTKSMGLADGWHWPTSAAFADLDDDGDLDLYVCQYLRWDERDPRICREGPTGRYIACDPLLLEALPDRVFRNDGVRFVERTSLAGSNDPAGRGLGVVAIDFDGDRRTDLFVANDKSANKLYMNRGDWVFEETALTAGVAANSEGGFQAGMGTDAGDIDGDGRPDIVVTNFFGEGTSVFRNLGDGQFSEMAKPWGILAPSRFLLGFGVALADFDSDGLTDYVSINGHVNDLPDIRQAMPLQLLAGQGPGGFRRPVARKGDPLAFESVGRALALGDLDSDGRIDLVTVSLDSPMRILRNVTPEAGVDRVTIRLVGRQSNRDGIGARVRVITAAGKTIVRFRNGGGSYQSANTGLVHASVRSDRIVKVCVEWPSGREQEIVVDPERTGRTIVIEER